MVFCLLQIFDTWRLQKDIYIISEITCIASVSGLAHCKILKIDFAQLIQRKWLMHMSVSQGLIT